MHTEIRHRKALIPSKTLPHQSFGRTINLNNNLIKIYKAIFDVVKFVECIINKNNNKKNHIKNNGRTQIN